MFKANKSQQISMNDKFLKLPAYVQKLLEKSWAQDFAEHVFPKINEERFACLYSEVGSRPNTPINVIVGSMMLKEYFGMTEEELLMSIYCDVLFQYALHLTQDEQPPLSDRTWSRFRQRLLEHEAKTGEDLMKAEMESLAKAHVDFMNLKGNVKRMDSLMVASHCRRMSRLEIIYTVCENAVRLLNRLGIMEYIPQGCAHYLDEDDRNDVIYRCRGEETENRLLRVIQEAEALKTSLESATLTDHDEYAMLCRVLGEQTETNQEGKLVPKDNKAIRSGSLQNPSDPDATFRRKAGEAHQGYVGNVVETVCDDGLGIVTTMDYAPNTHSDSQFLKDYLAQRPDDAMPETMVTDGAFGGQENVQEARAKGVELVTTALSGKDPDVVMGEFTFSEDGTEVLSCPMGNAPEKTTCNHKTGMCRVKFRRCCCENCPYRDRCRAREQKKSFVVYVSSKMADRANTLKKLSTDHYRHLGRLRNGIECRPSLLRRRMNVDEIPVFGFLPSKLYFMVKTGASNLIALFGYLRRQRVKSAHTA